MDSLISAVSDLIGWPEAVTLDLSLKAQRSYIIYKIDKKNGTGKRTIYYPSQKTKVLQYALINILLSRLPLSNCALAYVPDLRSPTLENAKKHLPYKYSVRIDVKDFFPSIQPTDLFNVVHKTGIKLSVDDKSFLSNILFVKLSHELFGLAVGAPSSPAISNAVMYDIDNKLQNYSLFQKGMYTRYADDLIFSTKIKGDCNMFYSFVKELFITTASPSLVVNRSKTHYMSNKNKRVVTGLVLCNNHKISIGRKNKRYIRKLILDFKNNLLDESKLKYLRGYMSYVQDVDSSFFNNLCTKYGSALIHALSSNRRRLVKVS